MKNNKTELKIGIHSIGADHPVFVIAEVGMNHNGKLELAIELIRKAAECGAHAVKFQNWVAEDFISDKNQKFTYKSKGKDITESFYDLCKRNELPKSWLPKLVNECKSKGIEFLSTPTTLSGIKELNDLGINIMKNGSDYLTNTPLIRDMAKNSEAVIISTGMAFEEDVDYAIEAVIESNPNCTPILLHCTSLYPTPIGEVNMSRINTLSSRYNVMVGYSDHTEGFMAAVQAVALGAVIIEKHFTLDHMLEGPDHWFSIDPSELSLFCEEISDAKARMGSRAIAPSIDESAIALDQRLSAVSCSNLKKGSKLRIENVVFKKPGTGIHPGKIEQYFGRIVNQNISIGDILKKETFE